MQHDEIPSEQQLEARVRESLSFRLSMEDSINASVPLRLVSLSFEQKSIELALTVSPWSRNTAGTMHGGAIATCFDVAMSILCRAWTDAEKSSTLSLQINYCKPVQIGSVMHIQAKVNAAGKTIVQITAEAWPEGNPEKRLATASAVFSVKRAQHH